MRFSSDAQDAESAHAAKRKEDRQKAHRAEGEAIVVEHLDSRLRELDIQLTTEQVLALAESGLINWSEV